MMGELITDPTFPPLLRGEKVAATVDPFLKALSAAELGVDPGTVFYSEKNETLQAAIVLAPEQTLINSLGVCHALMLSVSDSLGALGPAELAVHFTWPFGFKVNGARCGHVKCAASTQDPEATPDWLVVGVEIPFMRPAHVEPGNHPDQTWLYEEGCVELTVPQVIESWSRHCLVWLNTFQDEGYVRIQDHWRAKCDTLGEHVTYPEAGLLVGTNEQGAMLLRQDGITQIQCLTKQMTR
jgi:BirA family transcriptional regulator, biotin operon repressor / biotin---[acetyl-CoA-carboxylase] ligase